MFLFVLVRFLASGTLTLLKGEWTASRVCIGKVFLGDAALSW